MATSIPTSNVENFNGSGDGNLSTHIHIRISLKIFIITHFVLVVPLLLLSILFWLSLLNILHFFQFLHTPNILFYRQNFPNVLDSHRRDNLSFLINHFPMGLWCTVLSLLTFLPFMSSLFHLSGASV